MFIEPTLSTWMHKALTQPQRETQSAATLSQVPEACLQSTDDVANDLDIMIQWMDKRHAHRPESDLKVEGQQVAVYDDQGRELTAYRRLRNVTA